LAKTQVTKQAAMAMLTQANSSPSKALDLLR
jgi:flagellin-like hook-associated protein FlgL